LKRRLKDFDEIKAHPFFSDIDWDAYKRKEFEPIYKPLLVRLFIVKASLGRLMKRITGSLTRNS